METTPRSRFLISCRRSLLLGIATWFLVLGSQAAGQVISREYTIKAGVLHMLGKCVIWPPGRAPSAETPLTIGIFGRDSFFENGFNQFDRLIETEKRKGVTVVLKRFTSIEEYQPCHILFVSDQSAVEGDESTVEQRLEAALKTTRGTSALVVGEAPGAAHRGAVANLVFDRNTNLIRLELNPDAATRAGLKLPPGLLRLKLVQIVRDSQG